ncbi:MAG: peptide chain release factor-like protein [Deltaproteobacteria bacterium]|nr:peptide chain release factor-like protein [Deltaproteobacteria bacterium]
MKYHLIISSGVGPIETAEFVALLAARLRKLCAQAGVSMSPIDARASKEPRRSMTFLAERDPRVAIPGEIGSHCLIALSKHRQGRSRKRWFASVSVQDVPETKKIDEQVGQGDFEFIACRAGGPGGQNVNKTNSAVIVRHIPSGLRVRVAQQRSQQANRVLAVARLRRRLEQQEEKQMSENTKKQRSHHYQLERGKAIRTYRLGPRDHLELLDE